MGTKKTPLESQLTLKPRVEMILDAKSAIADDDEMKVYRQSWHHWAIEKFMKQKIASP